ncbi:hypothetical protein K504DRAFT_453255 [Pleomassaria siparia CBS 279.74]|uniref:Linalool dehydratase/isomerase domain-containing protein n=1 Tax=Pleomassaria siparia CBS 279.74 TaxID=1314801 RepID=A0A6G1KEY0_9PLEO|nr:hypothetical protein K504DRAFT_453255 [Pleomassaria siparia CBS 279.74]
MDAMPATTTATAALTSRTDATEKFGDENFFPLSEYAPIGGFQWKGKDVLISDQCGKGYAKRYYQTRSLVQYALLFIVGLATFYKADDTRVRTAGLSLLFPGAGFVAVCTFPSIFALLLTLASVPLVLFMWFGCGGLAFPISLWLGSSLAATFLVRDTVFESAGVVVTAWCLLGLAYITWKTQVANRNARTKRDERNAFLMNAVQENQVNAQAPPAPGSREADERTLRFVQWILEMGLAPKDDFSYHDVIDQFQTSAIRYQLYQGVYELAGFQNNYCPNFHGYLSQAERGLVEKSMTRPVMNFWKWESLLGKFTLDWDPIKEDNIMVSGYILLAVALYQITTRDDRYSTKGSMEFVVTENCRYKYDLPSIADAVFRNMDQNPYSMYPCEPNWIYTLCNLVGMGGLVASDKVLGNDYGDRLKDRFKAALTTEFSNVDGTILPIRSEITGFTIPGLAGAISDAMPSVYCGPYLPHLAHRHWALMKKENLHWTEDGRLELINLVGADNLDPGNYKSGRGYVTLAIAGVASEFGDYEIRDELLRQIDEEDYPVYETRTGALKNKGLSTISQASALRSRLGAHGDWIRLLKEGPPDHCFRAPILDHVPFPDVLVAKAYSHDGESVELVLYNGRGSGRFTLGFKNMEQGKMYRLGTETAVADSMGEASFSVIINGRTAVWLEPVSQ